MNTFFYLGDTLMIKENFGKWDRKQTKIERLENTFGIYSDEMDKNGLS